MPLKVWLSFARGNENLGVCVVEVAAEELKDCEGDFIKAAIKKAHKLGCHPGKGTALGVVLDASVFVPVGRLMQGPELKQLGVVNVDGN